MRTEMIWVLVTMGREGPLLRMEPDELARLKSDFAGFKESGAPAFGSYTHYTTEPASVEDTTSQMFGWLTRRHYSGFVRRRAKVELKFQEVTEITGA
ncbi:MAG: hypothetical protein M3444_23275 [Acidobacteriota bacterium]|nr:hypothetical protein [Acidobacteriota bacterium]MDQ5838694.1 hypothetical protein [Acidobacteriota bacterium]